MFDWNRHSIAGDGKTGTGYSAYDNLILANGGVNSRCPVGDHTHAIDMHGTDKCGYLEGDHNCGPAGEYMDIEYNTILYTAGNGIHLRGKPRVAMFVEHNVFAHKEHEGGVITPGAMLQNETG